MQFQGKTILPGKGRGPALFTDQPVNLTGAFTKATNLLPWKRSEMRDRHHPLFGTNVKGTVFIFPSCIGSTHAGLVMLDLVRFQIGPAAIIIENADSLLVSGVVLSGVWYERSIPIVEHPLAPLRQSIADGQIIEVDGDSGLIAAR